MTQEQARAARDLLVRVKDGEKITQQLVTEVLTEDKAAREWFDKVEANKKLRANDGLGYAALRCVWAGDARKALNARIENEFGGEGE